jgi:hypothetical protein
LLSFNELYGLIKETMSQFQMQNPIKLYFDIKREDAGIFGEGYFASNANIECKCLRFFEEWAGKVFISKIAHKT